MRVNGSISNKRTTWTLQLLVYNINSARKMNNLCNNRSSSKINRFIHRSSSLSRNRNYCRRKLPNFIREAQVQYQIWIPPMLNNKIKIQYYLWLKNLTPAKGIMISFNHLKVRLNSKGTKVKPWPIQQISFSKTTIPLSRPLIRKTHHYQSLIKLFTGPPWA